ncbi:MAG: MFS transporter [Acidobacteriales bacterium]|nr:MAG: MFS transporter [Terriglobales bacterium]
MGASGDGRRRAVRFIVLLGVVSLLADITYEGARSISGPYLGMLGAGAAVVAAVAGAGELIGYALRLASGYLADRTRSYWTLTLAGYAVNLLAVPALALAGRWEVAAALMITERLGKAIRTPARDVLLADAAKAVGTGWGFGLHEAMDQIGALAGPLIVAGVIASMGSYRAGFAILLIPAVAALAVLTAARHRHSRPDLPRDGRPAKAAARLPRVFWLYVAATAMIAAGYADFPLIAFHLKSVGAASDVTIPLLYALAMGVDAVAALVFGRLYDRFGRLVVIGAPAFAAAAAPLVFSRSLPGAAAGMVLWGVGMGSQESVLRAAVADMAPEGRRGAAYGVFNGVFGVAWFAGSAAMGLLYQSSPMALVVFSIAAQTGAVPFLVMSRK